MYTRGPSSHLPPHVVKISHTQDWQTESGAVCLPNVYLQAAAPKPTPPWLASQQPSSLTELPSQQLQSNQPSGFGLDPPAIKIEPTSSTLVKREPGERLGPEIKLEPGIKQVRMMRVVAAEVFTLA